MPILAIEGPDKSGKSTLFEGLKGRVDATFISTLPLPVQLMPVMSYVELRQEALWKQMYDCDKLYICDRSLIVSSMVYDQLFGRECLLDPVWWKPYLTVLYIDVPMKELYRRHQETPDNYVGIGSLCKLKTIYEVVLEQFKCRRLYGDFCRESLLDDALREVDLLWTDTSTNTASGGTGGMRGRIRRFRV